MKFAAIDIGSNAVRLLLSRVFDNDKDTFVKKESLVRMPIRLGHDVFLNQQVSPEKTDNLIKTMQAFRRLIEAYEAVDYMACATSAMREANNGQELVEEIKEKAGIDLQIIDGLQEAEIVRLNRTDRFLDKDWYYLYVDVGGGSTDINLLSADHNTIETRSFNIGTVRILYNRILPDAWKDLKSWLNKVCKDRQPIVAIGSGGNINKIFRLARQREGRPLSYKKIKKIYNFLDSFTFEERIRKLKLRPDRADVIIPASQIYLSVMKWSGIKHMYVPQIGLSDGMIYKLFEKHTGRTLTNNNGIS